MCMYGKCALPGAAPEGIDLDSRRSRSFLLFRLSEIKAVIDVAKRNAPTRSNTNTRICTDVSLFRRECKSDSSDVGLLRSEL